MTLLKRFEQVELLIPAAAAAKTFDFPDIPKLRYDTTQDIIITALETYPAEAIPVAPSGNPVATQAQLQNLFITLYVDDTEGIVNIPMTRLNQIFTGLATSPLLAVLQKQGCQNLIVDWSKSFLTVGTPFGDNAAFSVLLGVDYKKLKPGAWATLTQGAVPGL
jgi:hypothetical protein